MRMSRWTSHRGASCYSRGAPPPRRVRVKRVVTALVLAAAYAVLPAGQSVTAAAANPASSGSANCVQGRLVKVVALTPTGAEQPPRPGDGLGRRYYFALPLGQVPVTIPPAGFDPLTATPIELLLYGLPSKPTAPAALRAWTANVTGLIWATPYVCESTSASSPAFQAAVSGPVHYGSSRNWAGGMTVNGTRNVNTYSSADGEWTQTGFSSTCPRRYGYSTWDGLGGFNYQGSDPNHQELMQTGTDIINSNNTSIYPWWELVNESFTGSREVLMAQPGVIYAGDNVEATTNYTGSAAYFTVIDHTPHPPTNRPTVYPAGPVTGAGGQPIQNFYDGSTADFVTEAPSWNGTMANLQRPADGNTYYYLAEANNQPVANFPSWNLAEDGGHMQTSSWDGTHAWYDTWHNCYL